MKTKQIFVRNVVKRMDGTFRVTLRIPGGPQNGILSLTERNGSLSGFIRALGHTSYFENGKAAGNAFEFSGILDAGFFQFPYTARGTVEGDRLSAAAETSSGTFRITGVRTV